MCAAFCSDVGGDMFGVQFARQCFCGDSRDTDVERHGRTECDMPCSGDDSVTCGGREYTRMRICGHFILQLFRVATNVRMCVWVAACQV